MLSQILCDNYYNYGWDKGQFILSYKIYVIPANFPWAVRIQYVNSICQVWPSGG